MMAWITALALLAAYAFYDVSGTALAQSPSAETAPNRPDRHEAPDRQSPDTAGINADETAIPHRAAAPGEIEKEITGIGDEVDNINTDSEYATGRDLDGPPAQFPASRTPQ